MERVIPVISNHEYYCNLSYIYLLMMTTQMVGLKDSGVGIYRLMLLVVFGVFQLYYSWKAINAKKPTDNGE
jgi:hypothetical protein